MMPPSKRLMLSQMFDTLKNDTDFRPLRPLSMNQEKETQKNYACHILHVATSKPDPTRHPVHNKSSALDDLTWDSLPAQLKKVRRLSGSWGRGNPVVGTIAFEHDPRPFISTLYV